MFEGEKIYYTNQNLISADMADDRDAPQPVVIENKFMQFVRETQRNGSYVYREQLKNNAQRGQYFLRIEMRDLINFDDQLATLFRSEPAQYMRVFETAVETIYFNDYYDAEDEELDPNAKFQIQVHSDENPVMIRDL